MNQIEDILRTIVGVRDEKLIRLAVPACCLVHTCKGERYYAAGQPLPGPAFLVSGLFRFYTVEQRNAERTGRFADTPGQVILPSLDMETALPVNIQALDDSTVLVFSLPVAQKLVRENLDAARIFGVMAQYVRNVHFELQNMLAQCDAIQRYEWFLKKHPGLIERVPLNCVASYLGMTPVTLSRTRALFCSRMACTKKEL